MKFGGASLATTKHFERVVDLIEARKGAYDQLVVVVSAMGETTDHLLELARSVNPHPPRREVDMLITVGERVSMSLLAMALAKRDIEAMSFTGSQTGIITSDEHFDAKILEIRPHRILPYMDGKKVIIVAGFQGMSTNGNITTLGRGGSDTSAVAIGAALSASKIEFYKDVEGIYTDDPKINGEAKLIRSLSFDELLEIVEGAKYQVLHPRAIKLAKKNHLTLCVRPFSTSGEGTWVGSEMSLSLEMS